jgi:transposase
VVFPGDVHDVLEMIGRVTGRRPLVTADPAQKGDMRHTYADTSLARTDLGFSPTVTLEEVRDEIEARYGIVYQSKQSYYDLLDASGLSYHRTEKSNPKRDEAQVLERREEIKKNWRRAGKRLSGGN